MFFQIAPEVKEIEYHDMKKEAVNVGIITLNDLKEMYQELRVSEATVMSCESTSRNIQNTISVYDEYSFGIIHVIDSHDITAKPDKVAFYIKKNLFLVVDIYDADKSTLSALTSMVNRTKQNSMTLERLIYGFFSRLICDDNIAMEEMERTISQLEKKVLTNRIHNFNDEMLRIQKNLLIMRNYYEQILNIGEGLMENENDLFDEENLRYFKMLTDRVSRLSDNIQMLRDYISQVREAYQAQMDYNLNNIMKIFTVVTTIFMPLTLIVGWYGMNFTYMPELRWKYGYVMVITLTVAVVIFCIFWFKKKKLF
ncbi:MAG: hypothetical protein E7256_10890 [Lachnospiraceae bacterium]|nr:hypothetical protein [Lachnospiraceae bacterium]